MNNLKEQIKNELNNNKILLACSTGVDSMVLLSLLQDILPNNLIVVAHVNHGVRRESDIEEEYLKTYCKDNNLKLYITHLNLPSNNFEEEARNKRYEFLYDIAYKEHIKYILTAHHFNDNIETIIMRLLKKSSLQGYAGIKEKSFINDFIIYRPLINTKKEDLLAYASINNIKYFNDYTNDQDNHMRNRIRKYIIPNLEKENPNIVEAIKYYSDTLNDVSDYLDFNIDKFINDNVTYLDNNSIIKFNIDNLLKESPFFQKQLVFRLLKPYKLSNTCIDEILKNITSNNKKIVYKINNDINFIKEYGYIIFTTKDITPLDFNLEITEDGIYTLPNDRLLEVKRNICYLTSNDEKICYNIDGLPIKVRTRLKKDILIRKKKVNNDTYYYEQSLSNFLTNKKLPYLERINLLVIEQDNKIKYLLNNKLFKKN